MTLSSLTRLSCELRVRTETRVKLQRILSLIEDTKFYLSSSVDAAMSQWTPSGMEMIPTSVYFELLNNGGRLNKNRLADGSLLSPADAAVRKHGKILVPSMALRAVGSGSGTTRAIL